MALSKTRKLELERIIRKAFGRKAEWDFDHHRFENGAHVEGEDKNPSGIYPWHDAYVGPEEKDYEFVDSVDELTSCCGFAELSDLDPLGKLDVVGVALFELWLHTNTAAGIVATTAFLEAHAAWSPVERVLVQVGFKPVFRGRNPNTPNQITLWFLPLSKSTLSLVGTKPVKEKARATVRTNNTTRNRRR